MKQQSNKQTKGSFGNLFSLGYRLFKERPARYFPFSDKVRLSLLRAKLRVNHVIYISSMFFWTFTGTITSFLISLLLFSSFSTTLGLNVSFAVLVVNAFLICAVTGAVIFLTFYVLPKLCSVKCQN
jgi:hypothetical protein